VATCVKCLRLRRATTVGTDSARYCYSVWLRHLVTLDQYGFRVKRALIGELGPGDSIGTSLAALLSGATQYIGLDVVPFSVETDVIRIYDELSRCISIESQFPTTATSQSQTAAQASQAGLHSKHEDSFGCGADRGSCIGCGLHLLHEAGRRL